MSNRKWTFAIACDDAELPKLPSIYDLYERAIGTRGNKQKMYQTALNAALENLMMWEQAAFADGFDVICATDTHQGLPYPVFDDKTNTVSFVRAYGVMVRDKEGAAQ